MLDFSDSASPGSLRDRGELALYEPNPSSGEAENLQASGTRYQLSSRWARAANLGCAGSQSSTKARLAGPASRPRP